MSITKSYSDIIILGNTIPGIFAAWNIKNKLGKSIECLLIDQKGSGAGKTKDILEIDYHELYDRISQEEIDKGSKFIQVYEKYLGLEDLSHSYDDAGVFNKFELKHWHLKLTVLANELSDPLAIPSDLHQLDYMSMKDHIEYNILSIDARSIAGEYVRKISGVAPEKISVLYFAWRNPQTKLKMSTVHLGVETISANVKSIIGVRNDIILPTETTEYHCKLLLMALPPNEIQNLYIESTLLNHPMSELSMISRLSETNNVPAFGDFILLMDMLSENNSACIDWSAIDIYNGTNLEAELRAGYMGFFNTVDALRTQALTLQDIVLLYPNRSRAREALTKIQSYIDYRNIINAIWFSWMFRIVFGWLIE